MKNVNLRGISRIDATHEYILLLNDTFSDFEELGCPIVFGNASAPIYADIVSLSVEATVIEHFVQLLGDIEKIVFHLGRDTKTIVQGGVLEIDIKTIR